MFVALLSLVGCNFGQMNFVITDHPDLDWDNDHVLDSVDDVVPVAGSRFSDETSYVLVKPDLINDTKKVTTVDLNNVTFVVTDVETAKAIFGNL